MASELLPLIAAFERVAHHASFTRAAAELGVSPSALSQNLRTLEKRLGVRLLDRSTRRVGVTEIGRRFLLGAREGLSWWPNFPGFYLYHPSRAHVPRKLSAFIDFLRQRLN